MRKEFLPFSRPCISEEDISAVADVLRSGWITTGAKNASFEQQFNQYVGSRHSVALTSATAGMHILLKALNIGPGDEVITPAMTWVSTVNLIVLAGATPVFADIDRATLMVTADTVKPCLSSRTKMIIPVHFAGAPAELDSLRKLAADHGVFLVEDAAHAIGTAYKGERIGSTGTSIFSFHPIKNITTGEGGMFVTDNDALAERIRRLKFHGLGVDAFDRTTQGRSPQAEVIEPGYKYNMPDMLAVLGMGQLKRLDEFIEKRHALSMRYLEHFKSIDEIIPLSIPEGHIRHAWHLFIVRIDTDNAGITRDAFMEELKKRNIGTGLHFRAAHLQKYYRETFGFAPGMLPSTEWNSDRIFSLPLFPDMTADDVDDVIAAIKEVLCR